MKKRLGILVFGVWAAVGWAEETFSQRLTSEEYERAGLGKLSPAEMAQLDGLFKKYGATGIGAPAPAPGPAPAAASAPAPRPTPMARSTPPPPSRQPVAAVAPARPAATAAPAAPPEPKKSGEGFLTKARKALTPSAPKKDESAYETEIDGEFTGWNTTTVWKMKDGSLWRVDNRPQPFFAKPVTNPRVRIKEAMLGGYWLDVIDLGLSVRVKLVQ